MLTEPLPRWLDVCKAAQNQSRVEGGIELGELRRFRGLLASQLGVIHGSLSFYRDEERRFLVRVSVDATVRVACQRCLRDMPLHLAIESELAAVWSDEQARQLPKRLDPLLLEGHECDIWALVEDELILGFPPFSYHASKACNPELAELSLPSENEAVAAEEGSNPFDVLEQLKSGKKQQE